MDAHDEEAKAEELMLEAFAAGQAQTQESVQAAQPAAEVQTAQFQKVDPSPHSGSKDRKMDMLMDLTLQVSIELGRTTMLIKDILDLQRGSVVEFEKLASEPVDILINGKKMAEGEVVVIEKHFGIRITSLVETAERVKALGR
ncbi:MAG: flagellar motor switch protein FliN [Ignavibacteriales bacterium]|nr:flagellar motor switch protein FliN [Ignavibacteriales bacterium]